MSYTRVYRLSINPDGQTDWDSASETFNFHNYFLVYSDTSGNKTKKMGNILSMSWSAKFNTSSSGTRDCYISLKTSDGTTYKSATQSKHASSGAANAYSASWSAPFPNMDNVTTITVGAHEKLTRDYTEYPLTVTVEYEDSPAFSVYTSSGWKDATAYVYTASGWKEATPAVYSGGWKP